MRASSMRPMATASNTLSEVVTSISRSCSSMAKASTIWSAKSSGTRPVRSTSNCLSLASNSASARSRIVRAFATSLVWRTSLPGAIRKVAVALQVGDGELALGPDLVALHEVAEDAEGHAAEIERDGHRQHADGGERIVDALEAAAAGGRRECGCAGDSSDMRGSAIDPRDRDLAANWLTAGNRGRRGGPTISAAGPESCTRDGRARRRRRRGTR